MKIIFFCPSVTTINGGIKHLFRMAEALIAHGFDAAVFEQNAQRPDWFASTAPIVGQGIFTQGAQNLYVLPEDQPHILSDFAQLPQRKIVYSQNHFYGALGLPQGGSYADYGVTDILCSGRAIYDHARVRFPSLKAHIIPCAVDPRIFRPQSKRDIIAYMPRKRPIEALYIRDMVRFTFPQFNNWDWREIANLGEKQVADKLGEARVFLSLSRLEGFGLTPIEAMASGCVVAGFTGIGGREYARPENGFWAEEDDFEGCVAGVGSALACAHNGGVALESYQRAASTTLAGYTPDSFAQAVHRVWAEILK